MSIMPIKTVNTEQWYGRLIRNKIYWLHCGDRFYNISKGMQERNPISAMVPTDIEKLFKDEYQLELNEASPHYFGRSAEY